MYLGDSVARQFFPPGSEPNGRVRFLTSNGGLSIAGSYYLLEETFRQCPRAQDAVLLVRPETLQVNLEPPVASDFFCSLFHTRRHVAEVFSVKRDVRLTAIHVGRWLLPGTMAINSAWRQVPYQLVRPLFSRRDLTIAPTVAPAEPEVPAEPLLRWISLLAGGRFATVHFPGPDRVTDVVLAPVAEHYLARMQALCRARGGTLRVLASPSPASRPWRDADGVFAEPILYLPMDAFGDQVHVGPPGVWMPPQIATAVARQLSAAYALDGDMPTRPSTDR